MEFSPEDKINNLIGSVADFYQQKQFNMFGNKLPNNPSNFERIEHFTQAIIQGALPDAKTILYVALAFDKYINISSEDMNKAFELTSIQKIGNPAKQAKRKRILTNIMFEIACLRTENKNLSIVNAAEKISTKLGIYTPDCETLARYYSDNNWSEFERLITNFNSGE